MSTLLVCPGGVDPEEQWREHLADTHTLTTYSRAMHALATGPWATKQGECDRIQWCVDRCDEYYKLEVQKLLLKDRRRLSHGMATLLPLELIPGSEEGVASLVQELNSRKWKLLDVGSCYNPFAAYPQFDVTAIDISPATDAVHKCDFLTAPISPHPSSHAEIEAVAYDVVIFSLLLSYFPSPKQRLKCCQNAHKLLRTHGLLLIITPDSSHQNRHAALMKGWKEAIEAIGFHRWRYEKSTHLHCMAFRKVRVEAGGLKGEGLPIPQDREEGEEGVPHTTHTGGDVETLQETLQELPLVDCCD